MDQPLYEVTQKHHFTFLPRDAMCKRGLCCGPVSICLSVCLSVAFVHSIQTAEDIVKLICRPGSAIILVL